MAQTRVMRRTDRRATTPLHPAPEPEPSQTEPTPQRSGAGRGPLRLLALAAIVGGAVALNARFTSTSGFYTDDFINFRQAQVQGMSIRYLMEPTSAHFAPGHRLGDWVIQHFFPMSFGAALALMLVGLALSLLVLHRLLAELWRPGAGPLVLTLLYGTSFVHVGVIQWWASGLDRIPATILTFVSLLAYVRCFRTGSRRQLALSVLAMVLALSFYVKPVLIPLYLVLLRVLVLEPQRPVRETVAAAAREWRVWLPYAAVTAAYLAIYVSQYQAGGQVYRPSLANLIRYLAPLWFSVVAPGLAGIYISPDHTTLWTVLGALVGQLAVAGLVVWTIRRRRRAWRAWAFFALAFLANATVIGLTRIGYFGPRATAYILFYNLESTFLFVLAAGAALAPTSDRRGAPAAPRSARVAMALGVVVYLALSVAGARRVTAFWPGAYARRYAADVAVALSGPAVQNDEVALVDRIVPNKVVFRFAGLYTGYSEVLPVIDERVSFDVTGRRLADLGPDRRIRPVRFVSQAGGDARDLAAAVRLGSSYTQVDPAGPGYCVTTRSRAGVIGYVPPTPVTGPAVVAMSYTSSDRRQLTLVPEPSRRGRRYTDRYITVMAGEHTTLVALDAPVLDRLFIVVTPRSRFCLQRLEIGTVEPA